MKRKLGLLAALIIMPACAPADDDSAAAASRYEEGTSPFDSRVWDYELSLDDYKGNLGCDYTVRMSGSKLFTIDKFSASVAESGDRVVKGKLKQALPYTDDFKAGGEVEVVQICNDGNGDEDRPHSIGYKGKSTADFSKVTTKPGVVTKIPLSKPGMFGPAGTSLTLSYQGVEKKELDWVYDVNCKGTDPAKTDRFYLHVMFDTHFDDLRWNVSIDDGALEVSERINQWAKYCRPKGAGPSNQVKVTFDVTEKKLLRDRVYDTAEVMVTANEDYTRVTHTYQGSNDKVWFGQSLVKVLQ